jgi:hypothetical protein
MRSRGIGLLDRVYPDPVRKLILQVEEFVLDGMSDNRICLLPRLDFFTVLTLWKIRFVPGFMCKAYE